MSEGDSLTGLGVLVTRPAAQASSLCALLEAAGAIAIRLPAIDIEPAEDLQELTDRFGANAADLMIFTSANAVRFAGGLLERQPSATIAAIGPATGRALVQAGRRVELCCAEGADSEGLLSHPGLANPAGSRVLLVKGRKGRELLASELRRRGAHVDIAEVYLRKRAVPEPEQLARVLGLLEAGGIDVVTATSAEVAENLLATVPALRGAGPASAAPQHAAASLGATSRAAAPRWVVPGARVAAKLKEYGVTAPILEARSALDQDLVSAIVRWRAGESGA